MLARELFLQDKSMPRIDLVFDSECPNVGATRINLRKALEQVALSVSWSEHQIGDPAAPPHVRGYGSPTVLVDGRDVNGLAPGAEGCCRLYEDGSGVPSIQLIARALAAATKRSGCSE